MCGKQTCFKIIRAGIAGIREQKTVQRGVQQKHHYSQRTAAKRKHRKKIHHKPIPQIDIHQRAQQCCHKRQFRAQIKRHHCRHRIQRREPEQECAQQTPAGVKTKNLAGNAVHQRGIYRMYAEQQEPYA